VEGARRFEVAPALLQIGHVAGDDVHDVQSLFYFVNGIHVSIDTHIT
jgi:hypothetical protein